MDKYNVSLTSRALRDLDDIYVYIAQTLLVPKTAIALVEKIEKEVLSLKKRPTAFQSGKQVRMLTGGYRQLFVGNHTVIYQVDEKHQLAITITIRYSPSQFQYKYTIYRIFHLTKPVYCVIITLLLNFV